MLVCLGFVRFKPKYALYGAIVSIGLFPLLLFVFNYDLGWDYKTLNYFDWFFLFQITYDRNKTVPAIGRNAA